MSIQNIKEQILKMIGIEDCIESACNDVIDCDYDEICEAYNAGCLNISDYKESLRCSFKAYFLSSIIQDGYDDLELCADFEDFINKLDLTDYFYIYVVKEFGESVQEEK